MDRVPGSLGDCYSVEKSPKRTSPANPRRLLVECSAQRFAEIADSVELPREWLEFDCFNLRKAERWTRWRARSHSNSQ